MKPLILLTSSILLLSSCTTYRYDVTYEKCNGQTGSYTEIKTMPPVLRDDLRTLYTNKGDIRNVCDFSYQRNPIE